MTHISPCEEFLTAVNFGDSFMVLHQERDCNRRAYAIVLDDGSIYLPSETSQIAISKRIHDDGVDGTGLQVADHGKQPGDVSPELHLQHLPDTELLEEFSQVFPYIQTYTPTLRYTKNQHALC